MTPEALGRYEILGELGKGAMGVVYLARDPIIGRQLALKTFRLGYSAQDKELEQFRVRFLREAQSAGILNHPNIVTIHDVVEDDRQGAFFIAMEYVKGTDLKQLMQRQKHLEVAFVVDIVAQIAEGLAYAHSQGVVHRDVKPANIIITADKKAKITDFGIARVNTSNLTMEGQLLGTPNYMAPEQIQGKEVDHRADLFSLGVMLYEMITGRKPFQGENLTVVTHRIVYDAFTPPDEIVEGLPSSLMDILGKALHKEPAERYQGGEEMAQDLRAILKPVEEPSSPAVRVGGTSYLGDEASGAVTPPPVPLPPPSAYVEPADISPPRSPPQPVAAPQPVAQGDAADAKMAAQAASSTQDRKKLSVGRLAGLTAAAVLTALLIALAFRLAIGGREVAEPPDPEQHLRVEYTPLVQEGQRLLAEGRAAEAAEAFERALAIVPEDRGIRQLRDKAREQILEVDGKDLEEAFIEQRLEEARTALRQREYQTAITHAQAVLEVEPDHREAQNLLQQARDGLDRRRQASRRLAGDTTGRVPARTTRTDDPTTQATEDGPTTGAEVAQKGTLKIDFFSEASEGILTIYAGQEQILKEEFRFVEKRRFMRSRKTSGRLEFSRSIAAGQISLFVYLYKKGATAESVQVQGELPPGGSRVLNIQVSEEGDVKAALQE